MKSLITFLLVFSSVSYARTIAQANLCDHQTKPELLQYIKSVASQNYPNYNSFLRTYSNCENEIAQAGLKSCFANMKNFSTREQKVRNSGFAGFEMSRSEYFGSRPAEAMSLPEELKDGLPSNYRELAEEKGWKVLQYRSRTVGNPGPTRSFNRVLILIEGPKYDKYTQFTISERLDGTPERLIDFISVNREEKKLNFNQFWRNYSGRNPQVRTTFDTCFSCHPNGMRNISPAPGSFTKEDAPNLEYMNKKMDSYGKLDWGGAIHPDHDGPALGKEQACTRCHNGYTGDRHISRGALTRSTSEGHIEHKLKGDATMTDVYTKSEKDLLDFFRNVQNSISERKRKRLYRYLYNQNRDNSRNMGTYERILDWMKDNNEMSRSEYKKKMLILKGSSNYPECLGVSDDCYEGIERRSRQYSARTLSGRTTQDMTKWFLANCKEEEGSGN